MTYYETPLINSAAIFRMAGATPYHGRQVIADLTSAGRIKPVVTGTNRELLTPSDGEVLFNALKNGR